MSQEVDEREDGFERWRMSIENDGIWCKMSTRPRVMPNLPQCLRRLSLLKVVIQRIRLCHGPKATLQIVNDGPRHIGFGAIRTDAGTPVDIMVNGWLLILGICKI